MLERWRRKNRSVRQRTVQYCRVRDNQLKAKKLQPIPELFSVNDFRTAIIFLSYRENEAMLKFARWKRQSIVAKDIVRVHRATYAQLRAEPVWLAVHIEEAPCEQHGPNVPTAAFIICSRTVRTPFPPYSSIQLHRTGKISRLPLFARSHARSRQPTSNFDVTHLEQDHERFAEA